MFHHPLATHPTTSSTVTAAPPHLIVLRMRGWGFIVSSVYIARTIKRKAMLMAFSLRNGKNA
jgi:hypothetical protein